MKTIIVEKDKFLFDKFVKEILKFIEESIGDLPSDFIFKDSDEEWSEDENIRNYIQKDNLVIRIRIRSIGKQNDELQLRLYIYGFVYTYTGKKTIALRKQLYEITMRIFIKFIRNIVGIVPIFYFARRSIS